MNYQIYGEVLNRIYWGNRVLDYLISLLTLLVGIVIVQIFKKLLFSGLKAHSAKTKSPIDDLFVKEFERKAIPLIYFATLYLSLSGLNLNRTLSKGVSILSLAVITLLGASFITTIAGLLLQIYWKKIRPESDQNFVLQAIIKAVQILVWGISFIVLLDNMGIEITALIAGLGIGGIAVAFAAQALLADIFSYFTIFFDRPFEEGDYIVIDDYMGTVEHIGIKTTRIRSLTGEQLVFSNNDLTSSRVRNYKRMQNRRITFSIGVTYETSLDHLREIPLIIKTIIEGIEDTIFDRAHFSSYGEYSLLFEVVYYVVGNDYSRYMDIQQKINLGIREEFDRRGIAFALPTQTLRIKSQETPVKEAHLS